MFRKWEITDRDAMTRAFGHTYGFGDDSDLGEKALADFRSALLDELRTKLASHPKVVLLIGPIQAKRRAAFQAAVKEAMGEEAPAFASWLLYPKAKGSILPANISARIASYAKLAQRRKNAPKRPIWMPGSREIIPEPSEDLAKKTPAEIMAAHRALFDKTVPFARKEWGRAEVKAADRVFEV
jgi:hypothetical protein